MRNLHAGLHWNTSFCECMCYCFVDCCICMLQHWRLEYNRSDVRALATKPADSYFHVSLPPRRKPFWPMECTLAHRTIPSPYKFSLQLFPHNYQIPSDSTTHLQTGAIYNSQLTIQFSCLRWRIWSTWSPYWETVYRMSGLSMVPWTATVIVLSWHIGYNSCQVWR